MTDTQALIERYVALWNEPDADVRRKRIRELWATGGAHVIEPPQDIRDAARALGFPTPTLQVRGYDERSTGSPTPTTSSWPPGSSRSGRATRESASTTW